MELKEKQISSKIVYKGKIVNLYVDHVLCPNGKEATREVIRHCKAVAVIATINNKFIMEKQFRYPYNQELIEIPAGKVDPNEDLEKACMRELEEETGYLARKLVYLGTIYPTVAFCDEEISIYYANDLIKTENFTTGLGKVEYTDLKHSYENMLAAYINIGKKRLKVAFDPGILVHPT